ncbi:hypothetical protein [uncultured Pseudomonas sp.]|nr:hypothetical protein [uncultured Pseudomonas sp.]
MPTTCLPVIATAGMNFLAIRGGSSSWVSHHFNLPEWLAQSDF